MKQLAKNKKNKQGDTKMEDEVLVNIKIEDKKASGKFIIIMICSLLGGGLLGAGGSIILDRINFSNTLFLEVYGQWQRNIGFGSRYVLIGLVILFSIISFLNLQINKSRFQSWDGEDEEYIFKVEQSMGRGITAISVMSIISMVLFGLSTYVLSESLKNNQLGFWIAFIFYFASIVISVYLQKSMVNLSKQINPEKKGSVLDQKFQEKWINSCDEAEQLMIFKATYKSYTTTSLTCCFMMLILLICGMFFEIGILPIIIVGFIWLVLSLSYITEAARLEKGDKNKLKLK